LIVVLCSLDNNNKKQCRRIHRIIIIIIIIIIISSSDDSTTPTFDVKDQKMFPVLSYNSSSIIDVNKHSFDFCSFLSFFSLLSMFFFFESILSSSFLCCVRRRLLLMKAADPINYRPIRINILKPIYFIRQIMNVWTFFSSILDVS
jgi:hypothetical protein